MRGAALLCFSEELLSGRRRGCVGAALGEGGESERLRGRKRVELLQGGKEHGFGGWGGVECGACQSAHGMPRLGCLFGLLKNNIKGKTARAANNPPLPSTLLKSNRSEPSHCGKCKELRTFGC